MTLICWIRTEFQHSIEKEIHLRTNWESSRAHEPRQYYQGCKELQNKHNKEIEELINILQGTKFDKDKSYARDRNTDVFEAWPSDHPKPIKTRRRDRWHSKDRRQNHSEYKTRQGGASQDEPLESIGCQIHQTTMQTQERRVALMMRTQQTEQTDNAT